MAALLDDAELTAALATLEHWQGDRSAISRVVQVPEGEVDGFLMTLEAIAREMDHDPDVAQSGHTLTVTMSTHSKGGVTELDVAYARRVDALLS
jgi:4a-hydroxytetrahydrobiopterin dehydratase